MHVLTSVSLRFVAFYSKGIEFRATFNKVHYVDSAVRLVLSSPEAKDWLQRKYFS